MFVCGKHSLSQNDIESDNRRANSPQCFPVMCLYDKYNMIMADGERWVVFRTAYIVHYFFVVWFQKDAEMRIEFALPDDMTLQRIWTHFILAESVSLDMTRDETNGCRNCAWCEFYVRFYGDDVCGVFCCYFFLHNICVMMSIKCNCAMYNPAVREEAQCVLWTWRMRLLAFLFINENGHILSVCPLWYWLMNFQLLKCHDLG